MIARQIEVIDIDPKGFADFSNVFPRLSAMRPQAVLWHEEGNPRRLLINGRDTRIDSSPVRDARETAMALYKKLSERVHRVVVTDMDNYDRIYAAQNLTPKQDEEKYHYLERLNEVVISQFNERMAIYPEPSLDRGPVGFRQMSSFVSNEIPAGNCLVFAVFDRELLYFSFVARIRSGAAELVTSFDHWKGLPGLVRFTSESLESVTEQVEKALGPVACGLYLEREEFERLFDGRRHDSLPASLIPDSRAFGYSGLPGLAERVFLNTAGFFAYVPVWVP